MRTRRLLALAMILAAPAMASAQLLPNLPIRRERVPCDQENPQFRQIRQEYWGYYPTCWQKFPQGWGCPSAEKPDWVAAKAKQKLDLDRPADDLGPRANTGADPNLAPKPATTFPDLPQGGGLFNDDVKPPAPKPNTDAPAGPGASNKTDANGNVVPTAATSSPRRGRGFISGLFNAPR